MRTTARRASLRLGVPHFGSNAWAVAPSRSSTGGALLWGGPQVSYYVPQVIEEIEVDSGLFHARGMGVPGGGPAIAIGYTPHTAWSARETRERLLEEVKENIGSFLGGNPRNIVA